MTLMLGVSGPHHSILICLLDIQEVPTSVFFYSRLTALKKKSDYI